MNSQQPQQQPYPQQPYPQQQQPPAPPKKPVYKKVWFWLLIVVAVIILISVFSTGNDEDGTNDTGTSTSDASAELTFGSAFEFDDLEITIGSSYNFVTLENQFSEHDGADVIEIPVTIKNLKDETHGLNMFYYTFYGHDGNATDGVGTYFDNDVDYAGDMRSGATQETTMHIIYSGDGDYYIEFSTLVGKTTEIKLPISK